MHPSSVNRGSGQFSARWLVYHERVQTTSVFVRDHPRHAHQLLRSAKIACNTPLTLSGTMGAVQRRRARRAAGDARGWSACCGQDRATHGPAAPRAAVEVSTAAQHRTRDGGADEGRATLRTVKSILLVLAALRASSARGPCATACWTRSRSAPITFISPRPSTLALSFVRASNRDARRFRHRRPHLLGLSPTRQLVGRPACSALASCCSCVSRMAALAPFAASARAGRSRTARAGSIRRAAASATPRRARAFRERSATRRRASSPLEVRAPVLLAAARYLELRRARSSPASTPWRPPHRWRRVRSPRRLHPRARERRRRPRRRG